MLALLAGLSVSVSYVAGRKEVRVTVEAADRDEPYEPRPDEPRPGDRVRHRLTGYEGVVVDRGAWLYQVLTIGPQGENIYEPADERWERAE